jgi:hypothetical protein
MRFRNGSEGTLRVPRSSMVTYCLLMSARFATSVCRGSAGGAGNATHSAHNLSRSGSSAPGGIRMANGRPQSPLARA